MIRNKLSSLYHSLKRLAENRKINKALKGQNNNYYKFLEEINSNILFITNNHLGGTKNFESFFLSSKDYIILRRIGYQSAIDKYYSVEYKNEAFVILKNEHNIIFNGHYREIIISTLIDFDDWDKILDETVEYRKNNSECKLKYFVHDFHCICPKCNIFINGRYYPPNDPDMPQEFELKGKKVNLSEWQENWRKFLFACDEVRCFSHSSKNIILSAYPELDSEKITVVPHDMSYCKNSPILGLDGLPFHIGVVGACFADFKGKSVVSEMLRRYGNNIPVTLIGSQWWRFMIFRRKVRYLGAYERDNLENILIKHKISCVLFPSLCPETFSYLVSELMMMKIPVLCFDYGAQAEKIKCYEKGVLLKNKEDLWAYIEQNK